MQQAARSCGLPSARHLAPACRALSAPLRAFTLASGSCTFRFSVRLSRHAHKPFTPAAEQPATPRHVRMQAHPQISSGAPVVRPVTLPAFIQSHAANETQLNAQHMVTIFNAVAAATKASTTSCIPQALSTELFINLMSNHRLPAVDVPLVAICVTCNLYDMQWCCRAFRNSLRALVQTLGACKTCARDLAPGNGCSTNAPKGILPTPVCAWKQCMRRMNQCSRYTTYLKHSSLAEWFSKQFHAQELAGRTIFVACTSSTSSWASRAAWLQSLRRHTLS